ncbi:hypothetical protein EsVE80_12910 [Enterococcus saigonensis]|uniref:Uncharacterized protein n=1 Tax=Enterococcus saigonensis TaxID=1805431 RepID=A0A679I860_9ENTE|nr:hypothetical protein [Enterococcus saigonensis]BCA85768.1 hypothetical protein EsVE80_12910 [Enterococcus saigonensis]
MFYQQAMEPAELLNTLAVNSECFFVIKAQLPNKAYHVAVYKYDKEYFLLLDPRLFQQIIKTKAEVHGDEDEVLPYIEEALEDNLYQLVAEDYVKLDLHTLTHLAKKNTVSIRFYEFY